MTIEYNVFLDEKGFFETIIEALENGFTGYYSDLHAEIFNYGVNADVKDLEEYGAFKALGEIQEYEKDNFGEVLTDLGNASAVANTLYYILGDKFLNETLEFNRILEEASDALGLEEDLWNEEATEEVNKAIVKRLKGEFKNVYC
ncbi:hypothetical protein [Enterococcus phage vB_EfaS_IME198]|uniref:hypothetical protein n=1 Tax=Enterococcus phage vB_EfaS_IME198 TaxID=1747287 RepID=UPI000722066C|nr:hypothetical protein AVT94_gp07 [Enterococcus phage vB_EfaS_IME198]ALO80753.1 hypothetical protein [Enterococcus phage vB_EfaS_IME198]